MECEKEWMELVKHHKGLGIENRGALINIIASGPPCREDVKAANRLIEKGRYPIKPLDTTRHTGYK